jgi:INO80 complex subunit B
LSISSVSDEEGLDSGPEDYSSDNEGEEEGASNSDVSQSEEESVQTERLTARQRSILQAESIESTPSLESLSIPLTEEEQLRKSEKTRRRAVQRDLKLEQSKADTIKRLLQKQGTRSKKMKLQEKAEEVVGVRKEKVNSMGTGMIRYVNNKDQTCARLGVDIPLITHRSRENPKMMTCAVAGCSNPKKYLHSKLLRPVCSLDCYKSLK